MKVTTRKSEILNSPDFIIESENENDSTILDLFLAVAARECVVQLQIQDITYFGYPHSRRRKSIRIGWIKNETNTIK